MPFFEKLAQTTPPTPLFLAGVGKQTMKRGQRKEKPESCKLYLIFRYLSMDHWVAQECQRGCIMAIITQRLET